MIQQTLYSDNYIEYLDKILEKIAYYYIEDHAAFRDILSVVDKFDKKSSGFSQYGYIDSISNTIKMRESTAVLTDDIILRKNETFEDQMNIILDNINVNIF